MSDLFRHAKFAGAYVLEIPTSLIVARILHCVAMAELTDPKHNRRPAHVAGFLCLTTVIRRPLPQIAGYGALARTHADTKKSIGVN